MGSQRGPAATPDHSSLLVAVMAASLLACGGGGGGGGGPSAPAPPAGGALRASYLASAGVAANSLSWRSVAAGGEERLRLDLIATEVADLYGLSFDLAYPSAVVRYDSVEEAEAFSADGQFGTSLLVSQASSPGTLIVGLARLGSVEGFSGTGTLLTLELTAASAGSGSVTFQRPQARDRHGRAQDDVAWVGGSVTVR